MQHNDWATELKRLLTSKAVASADWDALLLLVDAARRSSVNDWHVQQTSGNYSDFLRGNGQLDAAARIDERIGDDAEETIRYWHMAAGTSLAQAALDHFKLGNKSKAVALAERAIRHLGHIADPPSIYEELISTLRAHLQDSV